MKRGDPSKRPSKNGYLTRHHKLINQKIKDLFSVFLDILEINSTIGPAIAPIVPTHYIHFEVQEKIQKV